MPDETFEQLLDRAAAVCGIDPGYWDIWGKYHITTVAARQSILAALGVPAANAEELRGALAGLTRREWERLLPPAVVLSESAAPEIPINVAAESLGDPARLLLHQEDGHTAEFPLNLWELAQTAHIEMDGRTWVRKRAPLPLTLPLGYHRVTLTVGAATASTRLIVTPDHAFASPHLGQGGRAAGLTVSLYGVRSARNWGCGDFRDLLDILDFVAQDLEAGFVALNPLHAIQNRRPFNTSPYLPNSLLYQNYLYLDVEALDDFAGSRRARELWRSPATQAELESLRAAPFVESNAWPRSSCGFSSWPFSNFCASGGEARRAPASSRHFSTAKASCWRNSPPTPRSTSTCIAAIPACGCGHNGPARTKTPLRRKSPRSAAGTGGA